MLKTYKSLPTLNYHLAWSNYDNPKQIKKAEQKVFDFIQAIDVKKLVRDGIYETGEVGTVVTCLRNNSYVQFLELDDLRINKQRNGKWVVEYDLQAIERNKPSGGNTYDILSIIESLPDEITVQKYNQFKNKGVDYRFVELANCDVITMDSNRNFPWGLPITIGAWTSLMQKEIISRAERSVADRLLKQVLILYAGSINGTNSKDNYKPAPKPLIEGYFKAVSEMIRKKDSQYQNTNSDTSGTGVVTLPDFFKLESLKIDTTMFSKDLYENIKSDIFANLGVSEALVYGAGANFSSAQVNSEKISRIIFMVLEQFERVINGYISTLLPNNLKCVFYFDRTTMLDKDKYIDKAKEFYTLTGVFAPYAEALLGIPYSFALGLASYEQKVLKIHDVIQPPSNPFTTPGDSKGGRPSDDGSGNDNTNKSKSSGGNSSPSPSD